jgi:hypothetical protein
LIKSLTRIKTCEGIGCENVGMNMTTEPGMVHTASGYAPKSVSFTNRRLDREWKIMETMMRLYCRDKHGTTSPLCSECQGLLNYANVRLDRCRFGEEKPTCAKCPVHCYQRDRREQIKTMMRYAGPRMLWEHPVMSLRHWLDGFRQAPKI